MILKVEIARRRPLSIYIFNNIFGITSLNDIQQYRVARSKKGQNLKMKKAQ